jgi:hypothetical protein
MYLVRVQKYSMKGIQGLILLCFLAISISSCFDPPEFNNTPEISYDKIQFKEVEGAGTNDSLILYLHFKDGDGDLGLDPDDPKYAQDPYHSSYYYLTTPGCAVGQCDTTKVSTRQVFDSEGVPYILLNATGAGKLVTNRTRTEPGYTYLPAYTVNNCEFYSEDRVLVPDAAADASYNILDTLYSSTSRYFLIQEPLLYQKNSNHYNIEVRFFVHEGSSGFVEFNWAKLCYEYDGRFPLLSSQSNALEGTIRYGMGNPSYLPLFSVKGLRLEVRIKDRALNVSNKVSTPQFTLDQIRIN